MALAVMVAGMVVAAPVAHAEMSCLNDGVLCMRDDQRPWWNRWGAVTDDNENFNDFGWNDKGDYFKNQGAFCKVRIYEHAGYSGRVKKLGRGWGTIWRNIVSSNRWDDCERG